VSFTELDPNTALLVVDLQKGGVGMPMAHPIEDVIANTASLIESFHEHQLPVVLINVAGAPPGRTDRGSGAVHVLPDDWTDLIDELGRRPGDILITKYTRSAFSGTGLAGALRTAGVTQVVITGIATSVGVESTARDAHEDGFHVSLPVDAMTDLSPGPHEHSVARTFPDIAETGTTAELLQLLESSRRLCSATLEAERRVSATPRR
jgi:nicotinamidase-related amidase